ncbi:response regulator transcription factor NblR [Xenococcus sp. PCC 7305]|uniref:response regulator transcription factor NblR n=1 Tax=Xenococcus sp. PCC 7305 TaxID=102125 RepID=UPI0005935406|nr:response regulator transcription factor [Xenococcus sp. PCC 7305]
MSLNSSEPMRVLLLTDEMFARHASHDLHIAGYFPIVEKNLALTWKRFSSLKIAMVIIDKIWSAEAGIRFCHLLRNQGSRIPILMLLEQGTVTERVACLEASADDYLLKPYNKDNLLALIHLYLKPVSELKEKLRFGELMLDLTTRQAVRKEQKIDLTMKEFELLKYFMLNPGQVLSREEIIANVWGYDYQGESNVIEVYIRYLRLKIETNDQKRLIQTVRGVGYVLRET